MYGRGVGLKNRKAVIGGVGCCRRPAKVKKCSNPAYLFFPVEAIYEDTSGKILANSDKIYLRHFSNYFSASYAKTTKIKEIQNCLKMIIFALKLQRI